MIDLKFPDWRRLHHLQALSEPLDSPRLIQGVKETEAAISLRLLKLHGSAERQDIERALRSLRFLRSEKFNLSIGYS
jgi:hypothetical protein